MTVSGLLFRDLIDTTGMPGVAAQQSTQPHIQAAQYANSRGLMNSDIAAEASSQAVMGAALPIAQHDAQVYATAAANQRQFWYTAGLQAFDATIQSDRVITFGA